MSKLIQGLLEKQMRSQGMYCKISGAVCEGIFYITTGSFVRMVYSPQHSHVTCYLMRYSNEIAEEILSLKAAISFSLQHLINVLISSSKELHGKAFMDYCRVYASGYSFENFMLHKVPYLCYQFWYEVDVVYRIYYIPHQVTGKEVLMIQIAMMNFKLDLAESIGKNYSSLNELLDDIVSALRNITNVSEFTKVREEYAILRMAVRQHKVKYLLKG